MKLKELLHGLDMLELHADETLDITGVHYDSRQVMRGGLFVAISGFQTDGHKYIPKAAENGAACIVCEKKPEMQIPYVLVSDARAALAVLGANWFGHPADDMCVIGITERQNDQHLSSEACAGTDAWREGRPHRHNSEHDRR